MSDDKPCLCWVGPPIIHEGHCCFDLPDEFLEQPDPLPPLPCDHQDEGPKWAQEVQG